MENKLVVARGEGSGRQAKQVIRIKRYKLPVISYRDNEYSRGNIVIVL